jgi:hypothetical protein
MISLDTLYHFPAKQSKNMVLNLLIEVLNEFNVVLLYLKSMKARL